MTEPKTIFTMQIRALHVARRQLRRKQRYAGLTPKEEDLLKETLTRLDKLERRYAEYLRTHVSPEYIAEKGEPASKKQEPISMARVDPISYSSPDPVYDPIDHVTAGELRSMGVPIDPKIPDCAWTPRDAMRHVAIPRVVGEDDSEMTARIRFEFDEPFRWVRVEVQIDL